MNPNAPIPPVPNAETLAYAMGKIERHWRAQNEELVETLEENGSLKRLLTMRALSMWQTMKALRETGMDGRAAQEVAMHEWGTLPTPAQISAMNLVAESQPADSMPPPFDSPASPIEQILSTKWTLWKLEAVPADLLTQAQVLLALAQKKNYDTLLSEGGPLTHDEADDLIASITSTRPEKADAIFLWAFSATDERSANKVRIARERGRRLAQNLERLRGCKTPPEAAQCLWDRLMEAFELTAIALSPEAETSVLDDAPPISLWRRYRSLPSSISAPNYHAPIPPDKMDVMIPAIIALAKEASNPETFATSLLKFGPKAPAFSQSLWLFAKGGGAQGPLEPDWPNIYIDLRTRQILAGPAESEATVSSPQSDPWFLPRLIWMRDNQPERLRELAKSPQELMELVDGVVQQASASYAKMLKTGMDREDARETAWAEILTPAPSAPQEADELNLPMGETEWFSLLEIVDSIPGTDANAHAMSDVPRPEPSVPLWQDSPEAVAAAKAFIGHPAYTRAELDELDRKHAAEGPRPKVSIPDPLLQPPWVFLSPAEIDLLRKPKDTVAPAIRRVLVAGDRGPRVADPHLDPEEAIPAFQRAVEASHNSENWTDSALMVLFALNRGLRSGPLYLLGAYAIAAAVGFREARDLLLEGEDLLSDEGLFHFNMACYECRLGNLEIAESRLRRALQLDERFVEEAAEDPDLESLWEPFRKKWGSDQKRV